MNNPTLKRNSGGPNAIFIEILLVKIASGKARGLSCATTAATTTSRGIAVTLQLVAELLRAEGRQGELHPSENLVTHEAEKVWL